MRRLLTKAEERLSEEGREKLLDLLRAGDPAGHVATTWQAKELIRSLYDHVNEALALEFITRLSQDCKNAAPPRCAASGARYSNGNTRSLPGIKPTSQTGPTEAMIIWSRFGFRSFRNYRIRALLYAGKPNWSLLATITPR